MEEKFKSFLRKNEDKIRKFDEKYSKHGGNIMIISFIPQLFMMWSTLSSEGFSITFITFISLGLFLITMNSFVVYLDTGKTSTMNNQLKNITAALVTLLSAVILRVAPYIHNLIK